MTTATQVPCRVCGTATTEGVTTEVVPDFSVTRPTFTTEVGTCPSCASLRPDEPGSAVRAALRLINKPEDDWRLAAGAFEEAGVDVSALLYGPRRLDKGKAWAHVSRDLKADLRRAYVGVLDRRVFAAVDHDRPMPAHAPDPEFPQACLGCGVGRSVDWHGPLTTTALTRGPDMITGVVCDACVPHLTAAGAVGAQFLERSVMAHFGKDWGQNVRIPRLRAWIALNRAEGYPPQTEPWAWVDLRDPEPPPTLADALDQIAGLRDRLAALEKRLP